ncbi:hypothetical protein M8J76_002137 [Diaphorina citri]|nr:hypothetical protein M8J76_002137 [Diaphorina citri]
MQFETIRKFIEEETNVPTPEKWKELRSLVLSIQGGKLKVSNVDGIILANCVPNLGFTKSFIKFLNHEYKKVTPLQMSHLFRSFYLNKQMCTPDDKAFIKKTFSQIVKQESVSHSMKAVEGFVAGISITDNWKDGLLMMKEKLISQNITIYFPLIEAAIDNDDMKFAFEHLDKCLKMTNSIPDSIYSYWIQQIKTRSKLDEFLQYLRDNDIVISKPVADLVVNQCHRYNLYKVSHTSVHVKSHQCFHCGFTLDPLTLDPADFDQLKAAFLDRALVGGDIFEKTTPQEFDKFLAFLNQTTPYDIVMDGLNVSHVGGPQYQSETLHKVIQHFLDLNQRILVLGRLHMLKWPKHTVHFIKQHCQFFFVDNLSQDDPYILYAAMYGGLRTRFISRDLMRSHLFLLGNHELRDVFLKWQQLNQIIILSVTKRVNVKQAMAYHQRVHREDGARSGPIGESENEPLSKKSSDNEPIRESESSGNRPMGKDQKSAENGPMRREKSSGNEPIRSWHVPYKDDSLELTFQNVYNPKATNYEETLAHFKKI